MGLSNIFDHISDGITRVMGSTGSILLHTVIFILTFVLIAMGWPLDKVLLVLTTVVSLEAIYMSIFIQRSVNKQSARLDEVVEEIRQTVKETHQAVIKVIAAESDDVIEQVSATVAQESDDVVREISEHVTEETDELAHEITEHVTEETDELAHEISEHVTEETDELEDILTHPKK